MVIPHRWYVLFIPAIACFCMMMLFIVALPIVLAGTLMEQVWLWTLTGLLSFIMIASGYVLSDK
jgi:hypothetical protein